MLDQLIGMLPAGDMLAGNKIHLPAEGGSHKQRVKIRVVVGKDDVLLG